MKLPNQPDIPEKIEPPVIHTVRWFWEQISRILNGNISLGGPTTPDNINGFWFTGITPAIANTEMNILHNLNRVPVGYLVVRNDAPLELYDSGTAWTSTLIYLKSPNTDVNFTIFIV
jgi:hypothetical protein